MDLRFLFKVYSAFLYSLIPGVALKFFYLEISDLKVPFL